uniref:Uncharacterized protein n=1 Tax=Hyaloperonospora arabidopsidis (strain Emoy2) TaxID=559515 RepID=M4B2I6_HYAAE
MVTSSRKEQEAAMDTGRRNLTPLGWLRRRAVSCTCRLFRCPSCAFSGATEQSCADTEKVLQTARAVARVKRRQTARCWKFELEIRTCLRAKSRHCAAAVGTPTTRHQAIRLSNDGHSKWVLSRYLANHNNFPRTTWPGHVPPKFACANAWPTRQTADGPGLSIPRVHNCDGSDSPPRVVSGTALDGSRQWPAQRTSPSLKNTPSSLTVALLTTNAMTMGPRLWPSGSGLQPALSSPCYDRRFVWSFNANGSSAVKTQKNALERCDWSKASSTRSKQASEREIAKLP